MQVSLPFTLTDSSVVAIIPARYQSTRFPGKPLADLDGQPMIQHVYRRAASATTIDGVIVATDDERIAEAVRAFGGAVWMTRTNHLSGTDRLAEVAAGLRCRIVVNVQGDEPLIEPHAIDAVVTPLLDDPTREIATPCRLLRDADEFASPDVVKVIRDVSGRALYFSRAGIPYRRGAATANDVFSTARAHVGLYAYRRDVLLRLAALPPSALELAESLEQLRALANGISIHVVETSHISIGVDTPDDLERVRRLIAGFRT